MQRPRLPITTVSYPGLACGYYLAGPRDAMPTFVSHNDVGLNYMASGRMQVLLATGYRYVLGPGQLAAYWGAIPHKVESYAPDSELRWAAIPLGTFLKWAMPAAFTRQLIRGRVFFETNPGEGPNDLVLLKRWQEMVLSNNAEAKTIVLLELEGRLRRLALYSPVPRRLPHMAPRDSMPQAERMLLLIAEHFREDLSAADVATAAGLHPGYASGLFKRHVGMGLSEYIAECRVSHAKALLATGEAKVLNIARESGFGSVSQFHAVFKKATGMTPRAFRQSLREEKS